MVWIILIYHGHSPILLSLEIIISPFFSPLSENTVGFIGIFDSKVNSEIKLYLI